MINKRRPKCGRKYGELENYCTKCGIELIKEENISSPPSDCPNIELKS